MNKMVFVFPGQGSQYVGMGRELANGIPAVSELFDTADGVLGFSIKDLCFNGPEERLKETRYTQPGIFTVSCAALTALKELGVDCDDVAVAGHSLGEYSALVAAGVLPFETALRLVKLRGELMFELRYPVEGSPMAAIIGLDAHRVQEIAREVSEGDERIDLSIFNCPGQYVISGHPKAIERAVTHYEQAGARKVTPLKVSGPFHSPLYGEARDKLAAALEKIKFSDPQRPFVNNVTGDYVRKASDVKQGLIDQMVNPVRWEESIKRLVTDGARTFVELGPGKVLKGLIRRIDREPTTIGIDSMVTLEKAREKLLAGAETAGTAQA